MGVGRLIRLDGMNFGYLTVLRVDEIRSSSVTKKHMQNAYWICLCSMCGCTESIRSDYLRNGVARLCFSCSYEARARYRDKVRQAERSMSNKPDLDQQPNQMKKKKLKIVRQATSPYTGIILISKPFEGTSIEGKVETLREKFNTSIAEIAELLGATKDQVKAEIARYKADR